jgi:hypothetical protein
MKKLLPMKLSKMIMSVFTLILLCYVNTSAVLITNPSFEDSWNGWSHNDNPAFYKHVSTSNFHTDGSFGLRLASSKWVPYSSGDYESFYQTVDLTGIAEVLFDVRLSAKWWCHPGTFEHFEGVFLVDGTPYWTQTSGGTYLDQSVNVSALSGNHNIELRIEALDNYCSWGVKYLAEWDNMRTIPVPEPTMVALLGFGSLVLIRKKRQTY